MQNRRFIAPKFHERPQIVSPLSAPPPEVTEEQKAEEVKEVVDNSAAEDKKTPKEFKKS
jgi:7,8-dihydro-6-hydroxymethylpterin-pyrophosphokinase